MRKKSYLSLIITAHFCCIIGSDIILTFQDQLTVLRYVFQTLFLVWGIFLCSTFLYAGYKVMELLKLMPNEMLMRSQPDNNHKGIMQLAMLAPYNNLASCLTAALMPTLMAPKIRITDENDLTFSVGSDSTPAVQHVLLKPDSLDLPLRRVSPVARRKSSTIDNPCVIVRPPTPVASMPSINIIPSSRRESLTSQRTSELSQSRRGSNMSQESNRRGSNVSVRSIMKETVQEHTTEVGDEGVHPQLGFTEAIVYSRCSSGSQNSVSFLDEDAKSNKSTDNSYPESTEDAGNKVDCESGQADKGKAKGEFGGAKKKVKKETNAEEEVLTELLLQRPTQNTDLTLDSILNHIAYVNRTSCHTQLGVESNDRKSQVKRVLHVTYATAILGLVLCLADIVRLYGPYGLMVDTSTTTINQKTDVAYHGKALPLRVWPWFCYQTLCRAIEFAMGCAMANITKQPANNRQPHLFNPSMRLKHRESVYI